MLRYYGRDKIAFPHCEDLVERTDVLFGKDTRKYDIVDELHRTFRTGKFDLMKELVVRREFLVTDMNIWLCEIQMGSYDTNLVKRFFEVGYKDSFRNKFLVHEAVAFYLNDNLKYSTFTVVEQTELFLSYLTAFIMRMCKWLPEQVNRQHVCGGIAPIHAVFQLDDYTRSTVLDALLLCNADINVQDIYGSTALHHAAWNGCIDDVEMLLERGASKRVKDSEGRTPFEVAIRQGNFEIAKRLSTRKEIIVNTHQRWDSYGRIKCKGGPLEFSNHVVKVPREPDMNEFINSLLASKHGSCNHMLADSVIDQLKEEVNAMMKRIAEVVKTYDPRFAFKPLLTGSVQQGGKVGPPDEFDFSCILTEFSVLCKEIVEPQHPGYCRLVKRAKVPGEFAEFFEDGYLNFSKVNARLFCLIEKSLAQIHLHGFQSDLNTMIVINPPYRQIRLSTVAYKLYLRCNSRELKNLKFKIDLAAVLSFEPFNLQIECFEGIKECLFVHIEDNNVAGVNCRISLTYQENAIFQKCKKEEGMFIIKSYGLLKALLSLLPSSGSFPEESAFFAPQATTKGIMRLGIDLIPTTYHIKQSLIKAVLDHDYTVPPSFDGREIEFWAKAAVTNLIQSYKTRKMPTPWLLAHNVMEDHTKRRSPDEPIPEGGLDRCFEYLLAHAQVLRCILYQENTVIPKETDDTDSDDFDDSHEVPRYRWYD